MVRDKGSSDRVDARIDARRDDPAGRRTGPRGAEGTRGRRRGRHPVATFAGRGLHHYRQRGRSRVASPEDVGNCCSRTAPTTLAERLASPPTSGRCDPDHGRRRVPRDRAVASLRPLDAVDRCRNTARYWLGSHDIDAATCTIAMSTRGRPSLICALRRLRRGPIRSRRDDLPRAPTTSLRCRARCLGRILRPSRSTHLHRRPRFQRRRSRRAITSTADLGAASVGAVGVVGSIARWAPSRAADARRSAHPIGPKPGSGARGTRRPAWARPTRTRPTTPFLMLREVAALGGDKMELARHIEATAIKVLEDEADGVSIRTWSSTRASYGPLRHPARAVAHVRRQPRHRWCAHPRAGGRQPVIRPSAYVGPPLRSRSRPSDLSRAAGAVSRPGNRARRGRSESRELLVDGLLGRDEPASVHQR